MNGNNTHSNIIMAVGLIISFIMIFIMIFVGIPYISDQQRPVCEELHEKVVSDVPIYSTEDGTAIKGVFFLGSGRIDTYMVYLFYTGDDINGFQRKIIDSSNVYIFRDSEIPHKIEKLVYKMVPISPAGSMCTQLRIVELHVPKNTLIKDVI